MAGLSKTDRDLCKSLNELMFFAVTSSLVRGAINKLLVIRVFGCKSLISLHALFLQEQFYKNNEDKICPKIKNKLRTIEARLQIHM